MKEAKTFAGYLAGVVERWVDMCLKDGQDWRPALASVIERRMWRAPLPVAPKAEPAEDAVQAAFESWLTRTGPSGDVTEVQRQWEASSDYADLFTTPQADSPVAPKAEPADEARDWARVQLFAKKIMALMDTKECALSSVSGLAHDASERADWIERIARKYLATPQADSAQPVADRSALTDEQIIAAARTAKAAHWNLTDAGCVLIGRAVLAAIGTPQQAEQGRPMTFEERLRDLEEEDQMFEDRDMGDS